MNHGEWSSSEARTSPLQSNLAELRWFLDISFQIFFNDANVSRTVYSKHEMKNLFLSLICLKFLFNKSESIQLFRGLGN